METWEPISLEEIISFITEAETQMKADELSLWNFIKIAPVKWAEIEYGNEGNGFWVVAVFGNYTLWYNDIEEGFNISTYTEYGKISTYGCAQDKLCWIISRMLEDIKTGKNFYNLSQPYKN